MSEPLLNIVLYQPQIPNNTGNIGRTAATTGCRLHLIHPLGFSMDEKARRRAGLDYWHLVDCREHASWESFLASESPKRIWLYTTSASRPHWDASFSQGDFLLFGQENGGLPSRIHRWVVDRCGPENLVTLPMRPVEGARSLNLATAVACAVYEGLRQISASGKVLWTAP